MNFIHLYYYLLIMLSQIIVLILSVIVVLDLHVDLSTSYIKDEHNRYRFYHGVNAVYKVFPFHPDLENFHPNNSLCDEDLRNLQKWGMNVIRLHVGWEGVEPKRNQYNVTYIQTIRQIIRRCNKYNISILLDSHQDLFNKKFCGEGFPDWTVKRNSFPAPLKIDMRFDQNGYPFREDCDKVQFAQFYLTYDVMKFQQYFFTNQDGLADQFIKMWKQVIKYVADEPNLIGYQIINQPMGGNIWKNPFDLLGPGVSNNKILLPFYKKAYQQIRKIDKKNIFFFQPSILDVFAGGFLQTPGGDILNNENQMFSYHLYCPYVTKLGEPISAKFCQVFDDLTLQSKFQNMKTLKLGGFLTEFGALSDTIESANQVLRITKYVEKYFNSWTYWQFKYFQDVTTMAVPPTTESFYYINGSLQNNKIKALSHPYAYAICGQPISTDFTDTTFSLSFIFGVCQQDTQIYINEPLYFPNGFGIQFTPYCQQCHLQAIHKSYYKVIIPKKLIYHKISLKIVASI